MHSLGYLITDEVHSPFHLQAASSMLTAYLQSLGHTIIQRSSYILGLEHVLIDQNPAQVPEALRIIRDPASTIQQRYWARKVLEETSRQVQTADTFLVKGNNVTFIPHRFDGTLEGLLDTINHASENPWYDYNINIEIPLIEQADPDFVALSNLDEKSTVNTFIKAALIKQALPGMKVFIGGNLFDRIKDVFYLPGFEKVLDYCDAIVYGDGFVPFRILAETLDPRQAPATAYLDEGKVVVNPKHRPEDSIPYETLPTPEFDDSVRQWAPVVVPALYPWAGCPKRKKCSFCSIGKCNGPFRIMSPKRVAEHIVKLGARYVDFQSESLSVTWQLQLGEELRRLGHKASWQCYMNFHSKLATNPALAERLKEAGCDAAQIGFESLSRRTLDLANKSGNDPRYYVEAVGNMHEAGIQVHAFLMCGILGDPLSNAIYGIRFLDEVKDWLASAVGGRARLARLSDDAIYGNLHIAESFPEEKPFFGNIRFKYADPRISEKRVDAWRAGLRAACSRLTMRPAASSCQFYPNRCIHSVQELKMMAQQVPAEPVLPDREQLVKMASSIRDDRGVDVKFSSFDDVLDFAYNIPAFD